MAGVDSVFAGLPAARLAFLVTFALRGPLPDVDAEREFDLLFGLVAVRVLALREAGGRDMTED